MTGLYILKDIKKKIHLTVSIMQVQMKLCLAAVTYELIIYNNLPLCSAILFWRTNLSLIFFSFVYFD